MNKKLKDAVIVASAFIIGSMVYDLIALIIEIY